jgi:SAM-dependent methyltransferase
MGMPASIKEDKYGRTFEQLKQTYDSEKRLASGLNNATKEDRKNLYKSLYDEHFRRIPDHPMILRKANRDAVEWVVAQRMQLLHHFLEPDQTFLEIGPGDCNLSVAVAKQVQKVYAVDVSNEIAHNSNFPQNFELIIRDGCDIPVPDNSIDIAYSHQLMEHLHPDDAEEQLRNIYKALAPGGLYICITPNRLSGPHDTSQYFDHVATGWHLKEYSVSEVYALFRAVGFSKIDYYKSRGTIHTAFPLVPATNVGIRTLESFLSILPFALRRKLSRLMAFRGITMVGKK